MNINIELIDEMRKRTNCSYQEAKELLEKNNGDLIEAIVEFEKKHRNRSRHRKYDNHNHNDHNHSEKARSIINQGFSTRFVIEKDEKTVLNIPIILLIIIVLCTLPILWVYFIILIALFFTGYRIRIRRGEGKDVDFVEIVDEFGNKVKTAAEKMRERQAEQDKDSESNKEEKEDGYNEVTVE